MTTRQRIIVVVLVSAILLGNGFDLLIRQQHFTKLRQVSSVTASASDLKSEVVSQPAADRDIPEHDPELCQLIHVNWATTTELQTLPGIGPALAQRIIEARQLAYFLQLTDLLRISGIGEARLNKISEHICLAVPQDEH